VERVFSKPSRAAAAVIFTAAMSSLGAACHRAQPPQPRAEAHSTTEQDVLVAELRALSVRTDPRAPAVDRLRRRFEALYREHPEAARAAPDLVREERELRGKIVLDALAAAGTLDGADALATIATDDTEPPGARRYALQRLGSDGDVLARSTSR
jgi:hypothetical protein